MSVDPATLGAAAATLGAAAQLYRDVLQPSLQKLGATLAEVVETRALTPLRGRVLTRAEAATVAAADVRERLTGADRSQILEPPARVAVEVIDALQTEASEPELRAMFANLLAGAMYAPTAPTVHPAFARVLRDMSTEDAHLLRLVSDPAVRSGPRVTESLADGPTAWYTRHRYPGPASSDGCAWWPAPASVGNLKRLGLIQDDARGLLIGERHQGRPHSGKAERIGIELTEFGRAFAEVCFLGPRVPPADVESPRA